MYSGARPLLPENKVFICLNLPPRLGGTAEKGARLCDSVWKTPPRTQYRDIKTRHDGLDVRIRTGDDLDICILCGVCITVGEWDTHNLLPVFGCLALVCVFWLGVWDV